MAAHHGSLSRKLRLAAENKLKDGRTARAGGDSFAGAGHRYRQCRSGLPDRLDAIDLGGLQRIGRAGHWRGAVPKGRIFVTTRDELLECAALVRAVRQGDLDRLAIPEAPLDILAQQIVAMCAAEDWSEEELFRDGSARVSVSRSAAGGLRRHRRDALRRHRGAARAVRGLSASRPGEWGCAGGAAARLAAITSGGAIPENSLYTVIAQPEGMMVGTVDEDFAVESLRATSFCWGIPRGGSGACKPGSVSWWKTRTEQRQRAVLAGRSAGAHRRSFPQQLAEVRETIS